ncbi:MAG: hypothetical protein HYT97_04715 [Elusimicrobia bacterium]|nr:hypothetical protein [Elusimicrobiota bacterium]
MSRALRLFFLLTFFLIYSKLLSAQEKEKIFFLSDIPNPNDFVLFANSGWDGNWYVGSNTCWIQEIFVPQEINFKRGFLGAKLGRAKTAGAQGKQPWEKEIIPGEIFMAISSTFSWNKKESYSLINSKELPIEPDSENALEGVGESRWFWVEIKQEQIQKGGKNYIALWSPTKEFNSAKNSPILAAGWGNKEINSWLITNAQGSPPQNIKAGSASPITIFEPAIALKLVQDVSQQLAPKIEIIKIEDQKSLAREKLKKIIHALIEGNSIERAWLEISTDNKTWGRHGKFLWNAPYIFSLNISHVPIGKEGKTWVRICAADIFENIGASQTLNLFSKE